MSDSDTHAPRDGQSRELAEAPRAEGVEYVLPANAPQRREQTNGHELAPADTEAPGSRPTGIWRDLFAAPSSSQILQRVLAGDPLAIEARSRARVEALAVLVDLERVVQCVMANVAYFAPRYRGSPEFEAWMRQRVEAGLERVLEDEAELDRTLCAFEPPSPLHVRLGALLGMNPRLVRPALVVFNSLPLRVRRVFCAVVVDGRALNSLPAEPFGAPELCERRLRCALSSISAMRPVGVQVDDGGLDEE